jgi:hypothetical protein
MSSHDEVADHLWSCGIKKTPRPLNYLIDNKSSDVKPRLFIAAHLTRIVIFVNSLKSLEIIANYHPERVA